MIDKNGKLFGKINIIDLLIVLIVIAAIIFVGLRFAGNDNDLGTYHAVRMTFFAEDAPSFLAGKAVPGDPVIDYDTSNYLGTVGSYEAEDAYTYELDPTTGEIVKVPVVNTCFLTFTCDAAGYVADDALRINNFEYNVGNTITMRAGQMRVECRLAQIEVVD